MNDKMSGHALAFSRGCL